MKIFLHACSIIISLFLYNHAIAQTNTDAHTLVKEGIALNDQKKYAEAIEKYNQALKIDTGYLFADYQVALSLFSLNKGMNGIPYIQKVINANTSLKAAAYDLSGLIYFSNKQYAAAETNAIEAIKLDPKHAGSLRMYALVCFHQNKRAAALLGFCSFILLEPNTARSAEAFGNIQHILEGGALKPEPGEMTTSISDAENIALNQAISQAVAEAGRKKYISTNELLAAQLKNIFIAVGQLAEKQNSDDFFGKYLAAYFYQLAKSPNMVAFVHLVNGRTPENVQWLKDNPKLMSELNNWANEMERGVK